MFAIFNWFLYGLFIILFCYQRSLHNMICFIRPDVVQVHTFRHFIAQAVHSLPLCFMIAGPEASVNDVGNPLARGLRTEKRLTKIGF